MKLVFAAIAASTLMSSAVRADWSSGAFAEEGRHWVCIARAEPAGRDFKGLGRHRDEAAKDAMEHCDRWVHHGHHHHDKCELEKCWRERQ